MEPVGITLLSMLGIILFLTYRRDRSRLKNQRLSMFNDCLRLLGNHRLVQDDLSYPVLTGAYAGRRVRIEPVVELVGFRKIPSLWLLLTVKEELPLAGRFDVVARVHNIEFYSPAGDLPVWIDTPETWPAHTTLKADYSASAFPLTVLATHVEALFADPRAKELLVSPRGVRIVYQAKSGERSNYLALRSAKFSEAGLAPELLQQLLDRAVSVCRDLAGSAVYEQ